MGLLDGICVAAGAHIVDLRCLACGRRVSFRRPCEDSTGMNLRTLFGGEVFDRLRLASKDLVLDRYLTFKHQLCRAF
jgi:hypothetical protein